MKESLHLIERWLLKMIAHKNSAVTTYLFITLLMSFIFHNTVWHHRTVSILW